jgi:hypothetical protein
MNSIAKSTSIAINDPTMIIGFDRKLSVEAPVLMIDATKRNAEAMNRMYQTQIGRRMKLCLALGYLPTPLFNLSEEP